MTPTATPVDDAISVASGETGANARSILARDSLRPTPSPPRSTLAAKSVGISAAC
jgi:hypothetical protein